MKILFVSSQDINSGSGRAAYRLLQALIAEGVDVKMIVRSNFISDQSVIAPQTRLGKGISSMLPFFDTFIFKLLNKVHTGIFSTGLIGSKFIFKKLKSEDQDIVHLHWVNAGTLDISNLKDIKAPIIWTLHDEWVYTGGCHVANGCEKYFDSCNTCQELKSNFKFDLSYWIHKKKKSIFSNRKLNKLYFVGLSRWLVNRFSKSKMLSSFPIINLPNCIDTSYFKPTNKLITREILNIPKNKKVILFGALNATSDLNKGYDLLLDALSKFEELDNLIYVILGTNQNITNIHGNQNIITFSHKFDEETLVLLYNASDVVVVPSRQENLSNTIMESMSCGTPVVAFNTGGNSDLIDHKINGYLANAFDSDDLFYGIRYVLDNNFMDELSNNAREKIVNRFSYSKVAKEYIELYKEILNR